MVFFCVSHASAAPPEVPEDAKSAFAAGDYPRAIEILDRAAAASPDDAAIQHLLGRSYFQNEQFDRAISAAEKSVALEPKNSVYHEWLGHSYGEKADRSGWLSALSLAKKARKEFETAVQLDQHNYAAMQALIEFDCSAPGMAGGGEDKARPEIEKLNALDPAEGRYAAGNCRRQKKDFAAADAEFQKALALQPRSAGLIYDIGDYYMKRDQADRLAIVVKEGRRADPKDPRGDFYQAVAHTIQKEKSAECARYFREYVAHSIKRDDYPSKSMAHFWLGRIQENQNDAAGAKIEYREAVHLEPRNRYAKEALSRLQRD
jgi:tetratricopeptide (TPR) repeat protein